MKQFAPEHPRDPETGWILFPKDSSFRKQLFFPDEVNRHPAKMNLHLQQSIIEYVGEEGQVMLDPFGGTGSLLIAALQGMRVVLLEIEDGYHELQQKAVNNMDDEVASRCMLLQGDNRFLLPLPCHHIITSPPYAAMMSSKKVRKGDENDDFVKADREMMEYTKSQRNIGKLNNFFYNQEMEKVYKLCAQSLLPNGTLTIILKDRMENQKRVSLTGWADRVCRGFGLELVLWEKWKTPGIVFTAINKLHGLEVVEDESIMIYRKVK